MIRYILPLLALYSSIHCQTIAEKIEQLKSSESIVGADDREKMRSINKRIWVLQQRLDRLYSEINLAFDEGATVEELTPLSDQVMAARSELSKVQEEWTDTSYSEEGLNDYAYWDQLEITLGDLINDFGGEDAIYLIPDEIADKEVQLTSKLPVPKAAWPRLIETILKQNNIGLRVLSPELKELYVLNDQSLSYIELITDDKDRLYLVDPMTRCTFIIKPRVSALPYMQEFLNSFVADMRVQVQTFGQQLLLFGTAQDILDILKIQSFITFDEEDYTYRLVPLRGVSSADMLEILRSIYPAHDLGTQESNQKNKMNTSIFDAGTFRVIALDEQKNALFIVGKNNDIESLMGIISDVEADLGSSKEKVVEWYQCKYSEAEEIATLLHKVYMLLKERGGSELLDNDFEPDIYIDEVINSNTNLNKVNPFNQTYDWDRVTVAPTEFNSTGIDKGPSVVQKGNFIVDGKTGSLLMIVEAELLPFLKDVLKRVDIPKKMVQIEVILFEKKISDDHNFGLNLLRLGDEALGKHNHGAAFNNSSNGVLDYIISRKKSSAFSAFDITYRFLLSVDDGKINAAPSLITLNQTPAIISVVEERSLSTGAVTQTDNSNVKDALVRAQYGQTIKITPTIHERGDGQEQMITLDTDVTFDTVQAGDDPQKPNVTKRHIENLVIAKNGETIILGGLKQKVTQENSKKIPFLGEIPGVGRLFSFSTSSLSTTEMFLFITPRVIESEDEKRRRWKVEEMKKRPGDLPELIHYMMECCEYEEKSHPFEGSVKMLLGR